MTLLALARRRSGWDGTITIPDPTTPPTIAYGTTQTLASDGAYNSFPGAVTCPNGDILIAWRKGTSHVAGGDLYMIRSTDNGATWGSPVLVAAATGSYVYGTAALSVIDNDRVALVTWRRPSTGLKITTHIFISEDNGTTWGAPLLVDVGATWLDKRVVSESPLVYRDGWYYLAVWGNENADPDIYYYLAGMVRSQDLTTWTRVALWDTNAPLGFNECGVANMGTHLVCVIRHETDGMYSSISEDGLHWTDAVYAGHEGGTGAPRLAPPMLGVSLFPLRADGTGETGSGIMAAVDSGGNYTGFSYFMAGQAFMYGQTCAITSTTGGVAYCGESGPSVSALYWRPFTVTAP